jgi:hypothetical protein
MGAMPVHSGIWILVPFSANVLARGGESKKGLVEAFVRLALLGCAAVRS